MISGRAGSGLARSALRAAPLALLVVGLGVATIGAVFVGGGNPLVALVPVLLGTLLFLMGKVPLRWSASALLSALLTLEDSGDSAGQWHSPLVFLGDLMVSRIDTLVHVPGLAISGMEALLLVLFAVAVRRSMRGDSVDSSGQVRSLPVLGGLLLIYVAAVAYADLVGLVGGAGLAPWKLRSLLHPLALYLLCEWAFRGTRDQLLLGRIVVTAACLRAVLVMVVQAVARAQTGGELGTGTNHGDSVLFSVAVFLLVYDLIEQPGPRRALRTALLLPIVLAGAVQNNRRVVWAMLAMMAGVVYLLSLRKRWVRKVTRVVVIAAPVLALYVAVGWNGQGKFFAPVRTFRSMSDSSIDGSTYWREVENFNLVMSIRQRPLLGIGLDREYDEYMQNADLTTVFKDYRAWPHNSMLGLLLFFGLFAFTALWWPSAATLFLAFRSYHHARSPNQRVMALGCVAATIAYLALAFADTGAHYTQFKVFYALALCMAGKLAVETGAWPVRVRRRGWRSGPALRGAASESALAAERGSAGGPP